MALSRIKTGGIEDGTIQDVDINDVATTKLTGLIQSANLSADKASVVPSVLIKTYSSSL